MCDEQVPELRLVAGDAHLASCHFAEEVGEVDVGKLRAEAAAHDELLVGDVELTIDTTAEEEGTDRLAVDETISPASPDVTESSVIGPTADAGDEGDGEVRV